MVIYFTQCGDSESNYKLDRLLEYLDGVISEGFQIGKIESPYKEFEICLESLSSNTQNETFTNWYKILPIYYRRENIKIIIIPANR